MCVQVQRGERAGTGCTNTPHGEGWLPPSTAQPRHHRGASESRHEAPRWAGGEGRGGWSRPGQTVRCLKNLSLADSLLGRVSHKRQPAF